MRVRSAYASSLADILTLGGVDSLGGVVLPVIRFVMSWPQLYRIDLELNEGSFLALGSRSVVEALFRRFGMNWAKLGLPGEAR